MSTEQFSALLDDMMGFVDFKNKVVEGTIVALQKDVAVIDVGLKSEGRVSLKELAGKNENATFKVGDHVQVYIERTENKRGEVSLSVEKARKESAWKKLEGYLADGTTVEGTIFGKVKGGFTVDIDGAIAFLPGSQVDVRPVRDITPLMSQAQPFKILKMDKMRNNIVVSRRSILEASREEAKKDLVERLEEKQVLKGVVKNITDYGAFIDLGGVDGLLHVTDISWKRINHPSDVLKIGEEVTVQVIRFNKETHRISLGIKQLETDPWGGIEAQYAVGSRHRGKVTSVTDYGAFVELQGDIEGLIHLSEMSWVKKNIHPSKIVAVDDDVEVAVLEVDVAKRRISLGLKQCHNNPWEAFSNTHPAGTVLEGIVRNITEFGLFVGVNDELDGMVHLSDVSWTEPGEDALKNYKVDDRIQVKVLSVDPTKERISLGIKQIENDPFLEATKAIQVGSLQSCVVKEVGDASLTVVLNGNILGLIKKSELSKDRSEQRLDRFSAGEKIEAKVVDISDRKVYLSVRAKEIEEDKKAISEYGSATSGASLGDILGAAMKEKNEE